MKTNDRKLHVLLTARVFSKYVIIYAFQQKLTRKDKKQLEEFFLLENARITKIKLRKPAK